MRTVREQLLVDYGGWGWDEWAREAQYLARVCEGAVRLSDMPHQTPVYDWTHHVLREVREANYHWVWCLMYFLMGIKEGK